MGASIIEDTQDQDNGKSAGQKISKRDSGGFGCTYM